MRALRLLPALLLALSTVPAWAAPTVVPYRVGPGSSFEEGCFGQCDCPVRLASLQGTFDLSPLGADDGFVRWRLSGIEWKVPELGHRVTGSGTFRFSLSSPHRQQLVLDLSFDGGPVERFDSGVVPAESPFPRIDVLVSQYDLQCYDRLFHIQAAPARPVTFEFTGRVTSVFDGLGALDPSVVPDSRLRGSFTFDPATPNTAPPVDEGEAGLYHHDRPPAGVRIRLGDLWFRTVPARPDFDVIVNNDFGFAGADEFGFTSRHNEARGLADGAPVDRLEISWLASTFTAEPLESAELPLRPPDLDLLGGGTLVLYGECSLCMAPAAFFRIEATLTSLRLPTRLSVDRDVLRWEGPDDATGYDVLSGELAPGATPPGVFEAATDACLADHQGGTTLDATAAPAEGVIRWFLVRPVMAEPATYDAYGLTQAEQRDPLLEAAGAVCP